LATTIPYNGALKKKPSTRLLSAGSRVDAPAQVYVNSSSDALSQGTRRRGEQFIDHRRRGGFQLGGRAGQALSPAISAAI